MKQSERLNLKELLDNSDYVDNTNHIRKVKHSILLRDDIRKMEGLKNSNPSLRKSHPQQFFELCQTECSFLYNNYTDIFNRVLKDEIDLSIMTQLLTILKMIEDEKINQEEGSVMVGKILKELYIDSALKRGNNLDKENEQNATKFIEPKPVSWKQYKLTL